MKSVLQGILLFGGIGHFVHPIYVSSISVLKKVNERMVEYSGNFQALKPEHFLENFRLSFEKVYTNNTYKATK